MSGRGAGSEVAVNLFQESPTVLGKDLRAGRYLKYHSTNEDLNVMKTTGIDPERLRTLERAMAAGQRGTGQIIIKVTNPEKDKPATGQKKKAQERKAQGPKNERAKGREMCGATHCIGTR